MPINFKYVKPILKYRFRPAGCAIESAILNYLGHHYCRGDKVTWERNRQEAYAEHHKGISNKWIARKHGIPIEIVEWWVSIWEMYDKAWGETE